MNPGYGHDTDDRPKNLIQSTDEMKLYNRYLILLYLYPVGSRRLKIL